jgi:hypothetical protein
MCFYERRRARRLSPPACATIAAIDIVTGLIDSRIKLLSP